MTQPLVSVIIPTYYRNDYLVEAIESTATQSYNNVEIIVIDDSGEKYAEDVIDCYEQSINYIGLERNQGAQHARNIGFKHSTGKFVQFLDDDDILAEEKLSIQVDRLLANKEADVAYCDVEVESPAQTQVSNTSGDVLSDALMFNMWPCMNTTMLIKRSVLSRIMPMEQLPGGDDLDLIIELSKRTDFIYVDKKLATKRDSDDARGQSIGAAEGRFKIISKHSELYEQYPDSVKNRALADAYRMKGSSLAQKETWTPKAFFSYCMAVYYAETTDVMLLSELFVSIFGSTGWRIASRIKNR